MPDPSSPDWAFLSREIQSLATTVLAVAARGGCRPDVVVDALVETIAERRPAPVGVQREEPA